jgi:predicted TIM-barrel fold metal-dependent hydrolase
LKFSDVSEIYPCFACFHNEHRDNLTSANAVDTRIKSPFAWKQPGEFPPLLDAEIPPHIPLLEKYKIPYIIDIHSHFFPEFVLKLIWKWFDSVDWAIAYRFNEQERVAALYKNRIFNFTTLNYAHKPEMASWLNDWTYSNYKNWKGAIPFGTFYPEPHVLDYVKKAVESYQFKGFKLHCEVGKFDLNRSELASTFAYLQDCQIPIVIHTGNAPLPGEFTGVMFFKQLMNTYPKLKVIVAHMGANEISEYARLLDDCENLALDTTMVFVDFLATGSDAEFAIPLLETYMDRIYFGSDFPNIPYNLSHPIMNLLSLPISDNAKRKILYENGKRLLAD